MATNLIFETHLKQLRAQTETQRMEVAQKKKDYYENKFLDYRDDILNGHFTYPERVVSEFEYYNLEAKIINRISKVLKNGVNIRLEQSFAQEFFNNDVINNLAQAETYANLLGMVATRFYYDNSKLKTEIITPNRFMIITEDNNSLKMKAFIWSRQNYTELNLQPVQWYAYDDTYFYVLDSDFATITQEEHGYNTIPVALMYSALPVDNIYTESDNDIMLSMENLAIWLTSLNHLEKYQGFSQLVGKGLPENANIYSDPSAIIKIPYDSKAGQYGSLDYISPDTDIEKIWNTIVGKVAFTASRYNLAVGDIQKTSTASGLSITWQNLETQEERQTKRLLWHTNIKTFVQKALEVMKSREQLVNLEQKVIIDIPEVQLLSDIEKKANAWLIWIANDVKNKAEWVMELNPDIKDINEALEILQANGKINTGDTT
jgi:hypothetical protein